LNYNAQKKCDFCGESIPVSANRCPYCASILEVTVDNTFDPSGTEQQSLFHENDAGTDETGADQVNGQDRGQMQQNDAGTGQNQQEPGRWQSGYQDPNAVKRPYYPRNHQPVMQSGSKAPMGNGMKVFLTMVFTLLPGIGQLAGIITAIVLMSSNDDSDRRSFGSALLVANIVMFVLSCLGCFILGLIGQSLPYY
jgi:hypothetical protein